MNYRFLIELAIILFFTKVFGLLMKKLGLPQVVGALLAGLLDGTIDMVATDHAPHTAAEKGKGLAGSAMGVVGLETAFAALYTHLVRPGLLPLERLISTLLS